MTDWQPIETAPRDGGVHKASVDLWCVNDIDRESYGAGWRFPRCRWLSDGTQVPRWITTDTEETVEDCGWRATHWAPDPPPPQMAELLTNGDFSRGDEGWKLESEPAPVDRSPEGQDPKGLDAKHESAVGEAEAPTPSVDRHPDILEEIERINAERTV